MKPTQLQLPRDTSALQPVHVLTKGAVQYVRRLLPLIFATAMLTVAAVLVQSRFEHAIGLSLILTGGLINLTVWSKSKRPTLPLIGVLVAMDMIWYGLPLLANHESLEDYEDIFVMRCSFSIFLYMIGILIGQTIMGQTPIRKPKQILALDLTGIKTGNKLAATIMAGLALCALLEWMFVTGSIYPYLNRLPQGSTNVIRTAMAAGECGAAFLFTFQIGSRNFDNTLALIFRLLLGIALLGRIASILLSTCVAVLGALVLALFFARGRIPYFTIMAIFLGLAFLNQGKFDMREDYWNIGANKQLTLNSVPSYFMEWAEYSSDNIIRAVNGPSSTELYSEDSYSEEETGQSLIERLSNYDLLLFINSKLDTGNHSLLMGETYMVCWQAAIPRVLWWNKPRSHIGQEIINVHFGRQSRADTFKVYISVGLIAESVANFGPYAGPLLLGLLLGTVLRWLEIKTTSMPMFALPVILLCFVMISLLSVTNMVMSVWLSSLVQTSLLLTVALMPHLKRQRISAIHA